MRLKAALITTVAALLLATLTQPAEARRYHGNGWGWGWGNSGYSCGLGPAVTGVGVNTGWVNTYPYVGTVGYGYPYYGGFGFHTYPDVSIYSYPSSFGFYGGSWY